MTDVGIYIGLRKDFSFHTIILKKKIGRFTFFLSIGYAGGRVYDEFYGKFWNNSGGPLNFFSGDVQGFYSRSTGSGLWEDKINSVTFNSDRKFFDIKTEFVEKFMSNEDEKIQLDFIQEYSKYIYYGYDEDTEMEYEFPELKKIDTSTFILFDDSSQCYYNKYWDEECLEITNSDIWGLSTRFPQIIDNYLLNI